MLKIDNSLVFYIIVIISNLYSAYHYGCNFHLENGGVPILHSIPFPPQTLLFPSHPPIVCPSIPSCQLGDLGSTVSSPVGSRQSPSR